MAAIRKAPHSRLDQTPLRPDADDAEILAHVDGYYRRGRERNPNVLYVNRQGRVLLETIMETIEGEPASIAGMTMTERDVQLMVRGLERFTLYLKERDIPAERVVRLAEAITAGSREQQPIVVVAMDGRALGEVKATRRHEELHFALARLRPGGELFGFLDDPQEFFSAIPAAEKARQVLAMRGYKSHEWAEEAFIHSAAGQWKELGVTLDEAVSVTAGYFERLRADYGEQATVQLIRIANPLLRRRYYEREAQVRRRDLPADEGGAGSAGGAPHGRALQSIRKGRESRAEEETRGAAFGARFNKTLAVEQNHSVTQLLINWYRHAHRPLPWRETRDPWRILVSEVMLQQTRVAAVIPYYERFLARFPDAESLAVAEEQELLTLWSGLGYYSRARNLKRAAEAIVAARGFPQDYEGIRSLPGVGDYTAAAVGSIALSLSHAVLDGNVIRVVSRLTHEQGDVRAAATRKRLQEFVDSLLPTTEPGMFNQAMMELGAMLCLPKSPQCLLCPVAEFCEARKTGRAEEFPIKLQTSSSITEEKILLIIERKGCFLLWQRPAKSRRLAGFWELPEAAQLPRARTVEEVGMFRHGIVNHSYTIFVRKAAVSRPPAGFVWVGKDRLNELPLSTMVRKAFRLLK